MEKYDDRIDGYNKNEYEMLAQAYVEARNDCVRGEAAYCGQINGDHTNDKYANAANDWQDENLQDAASQANSTTKKSRAPQIFGKNNGVEPTQSAPAPKDNDTPHCGCLNEGNRTTKHSCTHEDTHSSIVNGTPNDSCTPSSKNNYSAKSNCAPEDGCAPTAFNNSRTQNNLRTGYAPQRSPTINDDIIRDTRHECNVQREQSKQNEQDTPHKHDGTKNAVQYRQGNTKRVRQHECSTRDDQCEQRYNQYIQSGQATKHERDTQRTLHEQELQHLPAFQDSTSPKENSFTQEVHLNESSESFLRRDTDEVQPLIEPTPQVSYKGLNEYETAILNDLVQDLNQYFKDDFGLSEYLEEVKVIERPLLYFVSRNRILSKLMALLCSIYEKSRLSKELHSLVALLIIAARIINTAR